MSRLLAPVLAVSLGLAASMSHAGGPVVVEDDIEVVAEKPASSVGVLPVILVAVALCLALCNDDEPTKCSAAVVC